MPSEVSASKVLDRIKFCVEFVTKYRPTVTPPAITKLKTKKNLEPSLCTHRGSHKLVGIHARPIINVCR